VPEHIASIWADYTLKGNGRRGDMTFGTGLRFVGGTFSDDANTVEIGSYTVLDLAYGYDFSEDMSLLVNVNNALDTSYVTTNYYGTEYYGEGRSITAALKYTW
jgi:iron complex outermembrane receptor protein